MQKTKNKKQNGGTRFARLFLKSVVERHKNFAFCILHFAGKNFSAKKNSAFTLLELLVSIGVITLIGATSLVSFVNSRHVRDLSTTGQNVLSVLRLAQSKAIGGENNSVWGVRLEPSQFILFRGPTFSGSTSTQTHVLSSAIEIANILLADGGQQIVFQRLNGATTQSGSFDVRVRNSSTLIFPITVDPSGKVYQTGTVPAPTGTRIVDARHRAFTLGWSIKDYMTLLFTFSDPPNPDILYPVVMTPTPPRTAFDWTGTITVGGQPQTLRVHATSLTDTNTVLSVDRDCRRNTKQVKITIDTRDIATYEANCQTVTVGPFGGTIVEP